MNLDDQLLLKLSQPVNDDEKLCLIQELLKKGANANAMDSSGNRPIHLAILKSPFNSKLVKELIKFGALVNVINKCGTTPLAFSMNKGCHKTSQILVETHAEVNFQCQRGWTSLMLASMNGDLCSVKILLEYGANPNKCDTAKRTALMFACEGNYSKVIKALLDYGADPGLRDLNHKTAFQYYLQKSNPNLDTVNQLLLHCACFQDLRITMDECCKKLFQLCLRGRPLYHESVKTVLRVMAVLNFDTRGLDLCDDLYNFSMSCQAECRFMKLFKVSEVGSVWGLLEKCLLGYFPKESELQALLPFVSNNDFPIYFDFLRYLLKNSFLRKKFTQMFIYAKREGQDDVVLVPHINLVILSYLSDDDVGNFVLAAYINLSRAHEWDNKSDRIFYPPGKNYNANDLVTR